MIFNQFDLSNKHKLARNYFLARFHVSLFVENLQTCFFFWSKQKAAFSFEVRALTPLSPADVR